MNDVLVDYDKEIWKTIEGYPLYEVSTFGRVRNRNSKKILSPAICKNTGYKKVNLWNKGYDKTHSIHRLVAEAFIPNPNNKRLVNHIDCDKTNNHISNLEWATDSENMKHAFANGLCENTRRAAYIQQEILSKKPRTQRQIESARENIIAINKRPKTERQLEAAREAINSDKCRSKANEAHYDRHPPIRVIETGEVYRSQRDLAERLNVNESAICACLHGRRNHANNYHFEYVDKDEIKDVYINEPNSKTTTFLYPYQLEAVKKIKNGSILNGGVGSGKSRVGLFYYFMKNGGWIDKDKYTPMTNPQDLIIISTAQKRNLGEWGGELANYLLYPNKDTNLSDFGNKIIIDSWNNIRKYDDITGAFFLFDEDRVTGTGAWVKSFLKIAKNNDWIILSATPGDMWTDYEAVFIANGFFRNKTEFRREHLIYSNYAKYPKVEGYRNERRLIRLRDSILVDMEFDRKTNPIHEDVFCKYDISKYKDVMKNRWDIYKDEPITQASGLCYVLRRIVNEDESRQVAVLELLEKHPRAIIFYNFDHELDILMNLAYPEGTAIAQYNGHRHDALPDTEKWVYLVNYNAGNSGWNCIKTNCIIFYSQNYSYKIMAQSAGRIDRLNTPYDNLYYYHLRSRSGIDLAISRALSQKKKFNERKFTNWDK